MVAYSFKPQFVEPILEGRKGGTIRTNRKRHARPGEELQLYTGMRTKQCRLITRQMCCEIEPITLDFRFHRIILGYYQTRRILRGDKLHSFAVFDGFSSWAEMAPFWGGNTFFGYHIRWLPLPRECEQRGLAI